MKKGDKVVSAHGIEYACWSYRRCVRMSEDPRVTDEDRKKFRSEATLIYNIMTALGLGDAIEKYISEYM